MKVRSYIMPIVLLVMLLIITACGSGATTKQSTAPVATTAPADTTGSGNATALDGKALVQERCTECHTLSRVQNTGRTSAGWTNVVDAMIKQGVVLNADEKVAVIDYLAKTYSK
jgi:hypothetical protein